MFELITLRYRLPSEQDVRFFASPDHFLRKVRKHFLDPSEPWGRLLGAHFLGRLGRKLKAGDVSEVETAYRRVVEVLDEAIQFAERCPLYLVVSERITRAAGGEFSRQVHYLVSDRGLRVIVHGRCARTAYFCSKTPSDSYSTLFREAWMATKARGLCHQYREKATGNLAFQDMVEWYSRESWAKCPKLSRKYTTFRPDPTMDDEDSGMSRLPTGIRHWLDKLPSASLATRGAHDDCLPDVWILRDQTRRLVVSRVFC